MDVQALPVSKCVIPETRVTAVYDAEQAELMKKTADQLGILQPLIVVEEKGLYLVVDGKHRLQEAIRLGQETVDGVIYQGDAKEALLLNLVLNKVRGKVKASDMVTVIRALTEEYEMDSDQIQARTGLPREYIEKLWRISNAAAAVRQALDDGILSVGAAFEISRLPSQIQQDEMVSKMGVYRMNVGDVHSFVERVLAEMTRPEGPPLDTTPSIPFSKPRCQGCDKETEPRFLQPVALCPDCYGVVWNRRKSALKAEGVEGKPDGE